MIEREKRSHASCGVAVRQQAKKKQKTQRESRTKIERKSTKNRSEIGEQSTKIDKTSSKNRSGAVLGALNRFGDALGTVPRRPKAAPGPILEHPGRAKSSRESSKSVPWPDPRRTWAALERYPSAFGTSSHVKRARGTILRRFCVVKRKPEA